MEIVIIILLVFAILIAVGVGIDVAQAREMLSGINTRIKEMRELIAQLLASAAAQTTVVESFIEFHVKTTAELQARADAGDLDGVKEGISALQANTAKLAAAMVVNTESSDEVAASAGGTGDTHSVVDVAAAVQDAGGDPTVHGADDAGGGGAADGGTSGEADAGAGGQVAGDGSGTVNSTSSISGDGPLATDDAASGAAGGTGAGGTTGTAGTAGS